MIKRLVLRTLLVAAVFYGLLLVAPRQVGIVELMFGLVLFLLAEAIVIAKTLRDGRSTSATLPSQSPGSEVGGPAGGMGV
jgi:hypothetical protein